MYGAAGMRETLKAARVGLLVLVGVVAALGVYRYVDEGSSGPGGFRIYAVFDDVQGLVEKSQVLVAGIRVGTIDTIRLEGSRARVDMIIDEGVELHTDGTVSMKAVSLLGEQVLVIEAGSLDAPLLQDGDQIRIGRGATTTADVLEIVADIGGDVREVTRQLRRSFGTDEAGQRMENALRDLSEALEVTNRILRDNERAIGSTLGNIEEITSEGGPPLVATLRNIEATTEDLREIIDEGRPDIERTIDEIDDTVAAVRRDAESLEGVIDDVRVTTDRVARGEGTIGRLATDEALIDEVEGIAEGIGDIVGPLARLRTLVELRSEYNFLANAFKTYFSVRLMPRENRYFLVQLIDNPRGSVSTEQVYVRRSPPLPTEPAEYQETRTVRRDALSYTIQIAKRISFATFRFGIMESTGGLGMDLNFFDDRLELNVDIFDIGIQDLPRLRARLGFQVLAQISVVAGVDDTLNENRDFFAGLQIRFDDTDLKALLPFAPL